MQSSQQRSATKKSSRQSRPSPECRDDNHNQLLASKFGDLSQRGFTMVGSRQLEKKKSKNQGDNTEYIRNLYKKYLGKENANNSERKIKTDMKENKIEKTLATQTCKQKLNYQPEYSGKKNTLADRASLVERKNNFQKKSTQFQVEIKHNYHDFYNKIKDEEMLCSIGDQQNSLIRAMKIINTVRSNYI